MNTPAPKQDFKPMTADELTPDLIKEAFYTAKRYDRNLAAKDGTEVFPVPARTARLMALAILNLHAAAGLKDPTREDEEAAEAKYGDGKPAKPEAGYFASTQASKPKAAPAARKPAKAVAKKAAPAQAPKKAAPRTAKQAEVGPALTPEQSKAFSIVQGILAEKLVVTTRLVAERGKWGSHNTGARHIKNLVDLGYLKKVGKQQVIALTGLQP
jgi:hypothetical protein